MIRSLEGKIPTIHPTAFVSESAYVIGNVQIGEASNIWPGVVIRADMGKISIGRYTSIQDNSVVHGDNDVVIGDEVVIGHQTLCHAKTVGNRVLIRSGVIINDGVEIGEGSIIESGAMVIDGMNIPPHSIVAGIPARIRQSVHNTDLVLRTAKKYADKSQIYRLQTE